MDSLCRVRNKIIYVLSWWTVSALTRVLFWCLFPKLRVTETVCHSCTYIILYLHKAPVDLMNLMKLGVFQLAYPIFRYSILDYGYLKYLKVIATEIWLPTFVSPRLCHYGPLVRYVKLRVAHAPGMPGTFSHPPRFNDPDMPWCMPGSLTSGFLLIRWRGKRSSIPSACATHNFTYLVRGPWRLGSAEWSTFYRITLQKFIQQWRFAVLNNEHLNVSYSHLIIGFVVPYCYCLTQCSLMKITATKIWVNIDLGNSFLPEGSKTLLEPILTYHQWGSFRLKAIGHEMLQLSIEILTWKLRTVRPNVLDAIQLICISAHYRHGTGTLYPLCYCWRCKFEVRFSVLCGV